MTYIFRVLSKVAFCIIGLLLIGHAWKIFGVKITDFMNLDQGNPYVMFLSMIPFLVLFAVSYGLFSKIIDRN